MNKKNLMKVWFIGFVLLAMGIIASCDSSGDGREVIIEAQIIEIDSDNNTLIIRGINESSMNQIGDKCIVSCKEIKLFGESGEDIDFQDFNIDDKVNIMCDGVVQESYPTSIANVEWIQINNENK